MRLFYVHTFRIQSIHLNNGLRRILMVSDDMMKQELLHLDTHHEGWPGERLQVMMQLYKYDDAWPKPRIVE
jgi:hypothetical protein